MFVEGAEYLKRRNVPFSPPNVTWKELRAAIPLELYEKSTFRGLVSLVQDVTTVYALYALSLRIDSFAEGVNHRFQLSYPVSVALYWTLWALYWVAQSIAMAGCWCLGHEAGHQNISKYGVVNDTVGYFLHTCLLTPYFAWKRSHHTHHRTVGSIERDENYVPRTRAELGFTTMEQLHEIFEETPLYTLGRLLVMQLLGFQAYLLFNTLGCPRDPPGTNHFSPSSVLFKKAEYYKIVGSNVGLIVVSSVLTRYGLQFGFAAVFKQYIIPYLLCHHWIVMLTFLHHSDPTIPHYRSGEWTFLRGALATVDRPLLGFIGRMYFHNVSHDHIGHHLFTAIPYYNQPIVTEKLRSVLGEHYNYDSTNTFYALYRSFTQCLFIDDDGEILMYRNREGKTARDVRVVPEVQEVVQEVEAQ
ncbi:fatty acid desaturase-domain-containing protein [Mycena alexandri]|uniref:Fatty acid desaturase-domain-containing protein n=1 Tax=Mycena alexandri TaxID=1745969 RepID=A0AAD6WSI3_9AGAR|nr:fatty acid desaturase-domain-containing protein [Mycena alexandri]